jgi:hypothetical protein
MIQFGMSNGKVDDRITIIPQYSATVTELSADDSSGRYDINRNDTDSNLKKVYFEAVEKAILSNLDNSFEGYAVVYIDFENYLVDSVIYYQPNVIPSPVTNYSTDVAPHISALDKFADIHKYIGSTYSFRMLNSADDQKNYYKRVGQYMGAYPKVDDFPEAKRPA